MRHAETGRQKLNEIATAVLLGVLFAAPPVAQAYQLTKETDEAFNRYILISEARMDQEVARRSDFLWIDDLLQPKRDQADADLKNGRVVIKQDFITNAPKTISVPGGLIHDWTGVVLVPGASMSELISTLQDYDRSAQRYSPQVLKSKLLEHSGNDFHVFLRLKEVYVITVVLDTEYQVHYTFLDPAHVISRSYSTHIAEVENVGEPQEHEMPVADDDGFLWHLYTYWRFYESRDGVYVQCNAVSLTRDVPIGLGWLIGPFLETIPKDSLRFTLQSIRNTLIHGKQLSPNTSSTGEQTHEH